MAAEQPPAMQGVDRALRTIALLGTRGGGFSLDELSRSLGIPKSSLHRMLAVFRAHGFATQPEEGGRYYLGPAALEAAFGFHEAMDLRALIHPLITAVRERFDETAHMAVLAGADVVYLDKAEAGHAVRLTSVLGGRNPAHATGVGKAMLAQVLADDDAVHAWVADRGPLAARTPYSAVTADELAARLAAVRARGYAVDDEESELGVRCVAVPVFFGGRTPVAAVSVTAPKERMPLETTEEIGRALREMVDAYQRP
ncbi:IclR family transcriptional regulator [Catenulispora subtropica]|uniref:IclR family transcriptional regulator n=1 Tax=Catenulispora subtropica TaxID=450798 RepID=A0ABP5EFB8_9ACTN